MPIDSNEKRAFNLVSNKIQTEAKNSNNIVYNYGTKAAKVTKNSNILHTAGLNFVSYMGR